MEFMTIMIAFAMSIFMVGRWYIFFGKKLLASLNISNKIKIKLLFVPCFFLTCILCMMILELSLQNFNSMAGRPKSTGLFLGK